MPIGNETVTAAREAEREQIRRKLLKELEGVKHIAKESLLPMIDRIIPESSTAYPFRCAICEIGVREALFTADYVSGDKMRVFCSEKCFDKYCGFVAQW